MVFFPILLLYELCFGNLKKNLKKLLLPLGLTLLWFTIYALKIPARVAQVGPVISPKGELLTRVFAVPIIALSSYLELIAWPRNLTLYHSETNYSHFEFILRAGVVVTIASTFAWGLLKKKKQLVFWLGFFVLALLTVITPFGISWLVAERYVYLGAIGVYTLISYATVRLAEKYRQLAVPTLGAGILVLILLAGRTIDRSIDWKTADNLWLSAAKTSPSSPQNRNNLGDYYARQGNLAEAVNQFTYATKLLPCYADAHHNLANTYTKLGQLDKAIEHYNKALECNPNLWQSQQNLEQIYQYLGKTGK